MFRSFRIFLLYLASFCAFAVMWHNCKVHLPGSACFCCVSLSSASHWQGFFYLCILLHPMPAKRKSSLQPSKKQKVSDGTTSSAHYASNMTAAKRAPQYPGHFEDGDGTMLCPHCDEHCGTPRIGDVHDRTSVASKWPCTRMAMWKAASKCRMYDNKPPVCEKWTLVRKKTTPSSSFHSA